MTIKMRRRAFNAEEKVINAKMARVPEAIKQFEGLQTKHKVMTRGVLTATELLEPVPRSVLLALLTNNLPAGVSLLRLNLVQKEPKNTPIRRQVAATSKYKVVQDEKAAAAQPQVSKEKLLETHIDIEGIAPSDLQVAAYIERLSASSLLGNVALVESKEHKAASRGDDSRPLQKQAFRHFKLTAVLGKEVHLTDDDIKKIANSG